MQILYLSNRPSVFAETWDHVRHFMPWVDEALVIVPGAQLERFSAIDGVTPLDEGELLGRVPDGSLDHVRLNVSLRRAALRTDLVDEVFLLADDDYRPLKPVERSFFGDEDRDTGYTFHELTAWDGFGTPFDEAQHVTGQLLGYLGAPRAAFGSHMPQIMRRDLWDEAFSVFDRLTDDPMVDEWSWYFDVASWQHPERFNPPEVYRTLCWPPHPHEFRLWTRPPEYVFENFYPDFYGSGRVFDGLPTKLDPATAERTTVAKLLAWSELGRRVGRLDFRDTPEEPWTKGRPARRATFSMLRRLRKAYDYLSLEEREAISQLQGAVERIERRLET